MWGWEVKDIKDGENKILLAKSKVHLKSEKIKHTRAFLYSYIIQIYSFTGKSSLKRQKLPDIDLPWSRTLDS